MALPDLLFIIAFLTTAGALSRIVYLLARRRSAPAARTARRLAAFVGVYLAAVIIVSLVQPQRTVAIGEPQCFDDWCITVDSVARPALLGTERAAGQWTVVTARVSSRMRGRRQSEPDAYGYLLDASGRRIDQSQRGQRALERLGLAGAPLGAFVEPNGTFVSRLAFDTPPGATGLGFVKERRSRFPGIVIIGDPTSLFHRRTIVPL